VRPLLLLAATVAACGPFGAHQPDPVKNCVRPAEDLDLPPTADVATLAGGWRIAVFSDGPFHVDSTLTGVLWLWPTHSTDSSVKTGKHAQPGDSAWAPLYGATDLDLLNMKLFGPSDEKTLRAQADPIYPPILVLRRHGTTPEGKPWQEAAIFYYSVVNRRDGRHAHDGAGSTLWIQEFGPSAMRGTVGPAGIIVVDTGFFCAVRISK